MVARLLPLVMLASTTTMASAAAPAAAAQAAAAAQQAAQGYHVVELFSSESTSSDQLLKVLEELGADKEKSDLLVKRLGEQGKAVVVAGSKESCAEAAENFHKIGMKTEVRPLVVTDLPSEYDGSDVVVAGPSQLSELLDNNPAGIMATFYAPWCGHCKTMVGDYKQAATTLKAQGIALAAIDGQTSPQLAQHLGVRAYPSIKWLKREGENLVVAEYQGERNAESFVRFATAAHKAGALKSKVGQTTVEGGSEGVKQAEAADKAGIPAAEPSAKGAEAAAPAKSKLGQSKVGASGSSVGVTKAKMPAEAEAEKPAGADAPKTEAAPAAAAA